MGAGGARLARRGRSRAAAVIAAAVALIAAGVVQVLQAFASGSPARPVDRDLGSYVLFGFDSLDFKGGAAPGRGVITGGNVGANGIDSDPGDSEPVINICANHAVTMDAGSQVVADSMRITRLCSVWDVYANSLTGGSDVVPENSGPTAFAAPILPAPPFPAFACDPAIPHTVETGATEVFGPGTYGVVEFKDDAVVTLQPGIYTACELRIGKHVQVTTVTGIELRIARTFSLSNDSAFGPVCDVPVYVRADGASGDNDVAINFSKDTDVRGRFLTPTGKIALGNHTDLFGSFFGRRLISDANVNVTGCEGNENESSTSTSSTSTNTSTSTSTSTTSSSTSSTSTSTSTSSTAPSTSTTSASTSTSTTVGTSTSIGGRSSSIPSGPFTEPTPAPPVDPTARLPRTGAGGGGIEFGAALFTLGLALLGRARPRPQSRQPQS